jgi:hypothetical protein
MKKKRILDSEHAMILKRSEKQQNNNNNNNNNQQKKKEKVSKWKKMSEEFRNMLKGNTSIKIF